MLREHSARTEGWSQFSVMAFASLWIVLLCNRAFWTRLIDGRDLTRLDDVLFVVGIGLTLAMIINVVLGVLAVGRLRRPVLIFFIVLAATTSAFVDRYGVGIDRTMVQNVFETDPAEAAELVDGPFLAWVLVVGVLPSLWLARVRVRVREGSALRTVMWRSGFVVVNLIGAVLLFAIFSAEYASVIRNDRGLRYQFNPLNAVYSTFRYVQPKQTTPSTVHVGLDASRPEVRRGLTSPSIFVLVVGETARVTDFSLEGHERRTNPQLEAADVLSFDNVTSCGTSTAVSLPCMFSDLGQRSYSEEAFRGRENLLDVLARAGLDVVWLDNNSGCKKLCDRVESQNLAKETDPRFCRDGECFDEILVDRLRTRLSDLKRDTVFVLHQKGSHGPAYWRRYPPEFEFFRPVCQTINLDDCSADSLHNAYDNTILYTDHVLARIIETLKESPNVGASSMLYVSDHGESLGEAGIYLHGAPRSIAPEVQFQIPMIFWASSSFLKDQRLSMECLQAQASRTLSHDNLFHSVLGALDVRTFAYKTDLDLFAPCREASPVEAAL